MAIYQKQEDIDKLTLCSMWANSYQLIKKWHSVAKCPHCNKWNYWAGATGNENICTCYRCKKDFRCICQSKVKEEQREIRKISKEWKQHCEE